MANLICLHFAAGGNKFHVHVNDISAIHVKRLGYDDVVTITIDGHHIDIVESFDGFIEKYKIAQMTEWQRRLYLLTRILWR